MKEKPIQYFDAEYLERCRDLTPDQIAIFLDQFRQLAFASIKSSSKLISIKVPEHLLEAFKFKAKLEGRPYQSIIKELMRQWIITTE
jgi:predicted DNA binding CopG/RHH family protein